MFLPVILSALTLMGAPASTPVNCKVPPFQYAGALGLTWTSDWHIDMSPQVCVGLWLLALNSETDRLAVDLNNGDDGAGDVTVPVYDPATYLVDIDTITDPLQAEGVAALVMLHEAHHAAAHDPDETSTECAALAELPAFLSSLLLTAQEQQAALSAAFAEDKLLPPAYHSHPCG